MEVASDITRILKELDPIWRKERGEVNRVLRALSDYALRMVDNDKDSQLTSDYVMTDAMGKLGPYSEGFPDWMLLRHLKETWHVQHVVSYL